VRVDTPPLLRHYRDKVAREEPWGPGAVVEAEPDGKVLPRRRRARAEGTRDRMGKLAGPSPKMRTSEKGSCQNNQAAESSSDGGYLSSPNSLTACPRSATSFAESAMRQLDLNAEHADEELGPRHLFFQTGIRADELVDAASAPPRFKMQFTVTGQTRRVKTGDAPPLGKVVEVNGKSLALFRHGKKFFAIRSKCCHEGGPLAEGDIEDIVSENGERRPCVVCPWHGWKFDLKSGTCVHLAEYRQEVFSCRVVLNEIEVGFENFDSAAFCELDF